MTINRSIRPLAALLVLALAACAAPAPTVHVSDRLSAPYVEAQHTVTYARGAGDLSGSERQRLNAFLRSVALRGDDVLIVTIPTSGTPRTDQARLQHMSAALARVPGKVSVLMKENLDDRPRQLRQTGLVRVTRPEGIKVTCRAGVDDLGCANAINLAHMISRPVDVLSPSQTARTAGN